MRRAIWIVGEPGVGKTTLVRNWLNGLKLTVREERPKHELYRNGSVFVAGHYVGGKFDGADTLPISDIKPLRELWRTKYSSCAISIFDGDKFGSAASMEMARSENAQCQVILLVAGSAFVAARRAARGTVQNGTWVAGRKTKSANFASLFPPGDAFVIDAEVEGDAQNKFNKLLGDLR